MVPQLLATILFFSLILTAQTENSTVKFYINNCINEMVWLDGNIPWGDFVTRPPKNISTDTSGTFVASYSEFPVDGSINSGNFQYDYKSEHDFARCVYHQWWSIFNTGTIAMNLRKSCVPGGPDNTVSLYACFDETDGSTNPTFVSTWLYYNDTDTLQTCQSKTTSVSNTCTPAPLEAPIDLDHF